MRTAPAEAVRASQVNPTPGNKAGGLTTMTEKNLGSFKTQGHRRILGILDCGDPVPGAGAWGINQAQGANDAYASTTLAMSGCHICLFTTGQGQPHRQRMYDDHQDHRQPPDCDGAGGHDRLLRSSHAVWGTEPARKRPRALRAASACGQRRGDKGGKAGRL